MAEAFLAAGALSVSFQDDGDQPLFEPPLGTTPVWAETRVAGLFEGAANLDTLQQNLTASQPNAGMHDWQHETLADQVWERAWMDHFHPMSFGKRLWVCPTGYQIEISDAVIIQLDPGLAFGTGTHPTTALCLEWIDRCDLENRCVIDYGCGSGILAVAALLLGARHAYAIDIDPQALTATLENARKNNVADKITLLHPDDCPIIEADLVIANILAGPLISLAPTLLSLLKPHGQIVLSGLLDHQASSVSEAYQPRIRFDAPAQKEEWMRLSGSRE